MASSKQMHILATRPGALAKFMQTGKLPQGIRPESPLITVLESIPHFELALIRGLFVDERLGYSGSRRFESAVHALRWAKPSAEVFGTFYAETWRIKAFNKPLKLTDVLACAAPRHVRGESAAAPSPTSIPKP